MESAGFFQNLYAGTEIEMIGVAKYYLSLDIVAQLVLMHGLDAAEGAHRHEDGGLDSAVVGGDESGPRGGAGSCCLKLKIHRKVVGNQGFSS